ncbi:hypothetical protein Sjap_010120 [Stephania japonica]|uniref:Uncharacterized protein n=1 Tax=Stephania japonica TaxID=461633 RepID=A0AAP0JB23_9MAGN
MAKACHMLKEMVVDVNKRSVSDGRRDAAERVRVEDTRGKHRSGSGSAGAAVTAVAAATRHWIASGSGGGGGGGERRGKNGG